MNISKLITKAKSLDVVRGEEWVIARRPVNLTIEELGEEINPELLVCALSEEGMIVGVNIILSNASDSEVQDWALKCMVSPVIGNPHRPGRITLNGPGLDSLQLLLRQLDIQVSVSSIPHPAVDEVVSDIEMTMNAPGIPPYLADSKLDKDTVAEFFKAAAEFYKVKPWKFFDSEEPIKLEIQRKKKATYWAVVMGVEGIEYGLSLYKSFHDLDDFLDSVDDAEAFEIAQRIWSIGFSYDNVEDISPSAQAEYLSNGWVIANDSAYPSAIVTDPKKGKHVRHPSKKELGDLTIAIHAIAEFMRLHRKQVKELEDVEDVITVDVLGEQIPVALMLPAPESIDKFEDDFDEDYYEEEEVTNLLKALTSRFSAELDRAQEYANMAWEEDSKGKRVKLAKQALAISEYCVDAYLILAEDSARDANEEKKLLLQAVEAGKNIIGEINFEPLVGNFWLAPETRPYMMARLRLAEFYTSQGDCEQAIKEYYEMLILNESDNLGVRYPLIGCLLRTGRDNDLRHLLNNFKTDKSTFFQYTKALLSYRQKKDSKKANDDLVKAIASNERVVDYLLGRKHLLLHIPTGYIAGGEDEAAIYADLFLDVWNSTDGAIEWLREFMDKRQTKKLPGL